MTIHLDKKRSRWKELALTHRSVSSENYERLEFLGDSLLEFIVSAEIFRRYPDADEGRLTKMRAQLVRNSTLARLARQIGLDEIFAESMRLKDKADLKPNDRILSNIFEAWLAAEYFDNGWDATRRWLIELYQPYWEQLSRLNWRQPKSPKSILQESMQQSGYAGPIYHLIRVRGKPHNSVFYVECRIAELDLTVKAAYTNKRQAEERAAKKACLRLKLAIDGS